MQYAPGGSKNHLGFFTKGKQKMGETIVWAYKPLKELDGETGLVECTIELAERLIASGDVQNPNVGALCFKEIEGGEAVEATPKKRVRKVAAQVAQEGDK
jgi:hypothetical protein